jgi:outer membrane lipase/esterase
MERLLRGAALGALALAAFAAAGPAAAQSYNRLVVFGDSLSDNGNLFAITGQPASPPYFQGRFSSGPVWTELLGFNTARVGGSVSGSINYAYGGAWTGTQTLPPGIRTQLASYTAAGGRFGADDLVTVWGGPNNIFNNLAAAGASPSPTTFIAGVAATAAADLGFVVDTIAAGGAGTILVGNVPVLSTTPQFRGTAAAPLADFAASQINTGLQTGLATIAANRPGTNIILMDVFKVGPVIANNPGLFGLTNVTSPCFNGVSVCSTPGTYFYFDGVHPTARGQQLLAALATDYLYYGDAGAATTLLGETAYRHRERRAGEALAGLTGRESAPAGAVISGGYSYETADIDARGPVGAADSEGHGVRMALATGLNGGWSLGLSGAFDKAEVEAGALAFDVESYSLDAAAAWRSDSGLFVAAGVGAARDAYDEIRRATALAPIVHESETTGLSYSARVVAGTWFERHGMAISPRVGLDWVSSRTDAWAEDGPAAAYSWQERTFETISAEVALRVEGELAPGFSAFVEGGYRDSLDEGGDAVRTGILANPARPLAREIEDPYGGQAMIEAGLVGRLTDRLAVEVGYRGRFADGSDSQLGGVTLKLAL